MAFIVSLIKGAILLDLEDATAHTGDVAQAGLVQVGRLQDDPEEPVVSLLVHENDPRDPGGWPHQQLKQTDMVGPMFSNFVTGVYEIGGGELWKRRFTIELKIFYTGSGMDRPTAEGWIDLVLGRCEHALRHSTRILNLKDEFGERGFMCKNGVDRSEMIVRGGPPDDWIGEGTIWYQVYTQRP